ncbi:MAG: ACT domain-containing protein, partial [Promethearchaeota archaeon]
FGKYWLKVKSEHDVSLIAVIGEGMARKSGIAGKVFTTLGENGINIRAIAQGSNELNISFIIARDDLVKAVNLLYDTFIEKMEETISFW